MVQSQSESEPPEEGPGRWKKFLKALPERWARCKGLILRVEPFFLYSPSIAIANGVTVAVLSLIIRGNLESLYFYLEVTQTEDTLLHGMPVAITGVVMVSQALIALGMSFWPYSESQACEKVVAQRIRAALLIGAAFGLAVFVASLSV